MKDPTRTSSAPIQPELVALRKAAEQLAERRRESLNTAHLLAAIAGQRDSAAAELLLERRIGPEEVLGAAVAIGAGSETLKPVLLRAREIMVRMGAKTPSAIHVLVVLLGERRSAAHKVLEHQKADLGRLRTVAMNLGLGITSPRKSRVARETDVPAPPRPASRAPKGVTIPLFPPQSRAPSTAEPATVARASSKASGPAQIVPLWATPRRSATRTSASAIKQPEAPAAEATPEPPATPHYELDAQKFPTLCGIGKNLTLAAARGELDPVVGRQLEIEQALDVLAKREGNNPCLIGSAGVGKTSVVRGLAQRIAGVKQASSPDHRIVIEIPVGEFLAGTGVRGALATRLSSIRKELALAEGRVVLFFDDIHQLFAADAADEIAGDLKLALAKGELSCIGATSYEDYRRSIEQDPALCRRFTAVEVEEPSREDAFLILTALAEKLEAHHHVRYDEEAIALSIAWSTRYLPGRALPDKALSIIDLAGARARRRAGLEVTREGVAEVVAELCNMPIERLLETDADRFLRLEQILAERVVGHGRELGRIARILRRNAAGLGARRPLGTFLLLGPTGVGKTETAKAVAEALFFDETAMTRIDMAEYGEPHAVAKLIGAPPGYVGHDAGGQLTEAARRRPYQVVLLDEIEKAHAEVLTAFLAVFDEGRLTDSRGRTVDFTNTVILMTSNIGADQTGTSSKRRVGFGSGESPHEELERRITAAARATLAPELYNRIDEVLVFAPLGKDEVRLVAARLLASLGGTLSRNRGVAFEVDAGAVDALLDAGGFDPTLGARPMRRAIARLVEAPLAELILRGEISAGQLVRLTAKKGVLGFDVEERADRAAG